MKATVCHRTRFSEEWSQFRNTKRLGNVGLETDQGELGSTLSTRFFGLHSSGIVVISELGEVSTFLMFMATVLKMQQIRDLSLKSIAGFLMIFAMSLSIVLIMRPAFMVSSMTFLETKFSSDSVTFLVGILKSFSGFSGMTDAATHATRITDTNKRTRQCSIATATVAEN